MKPRRYFSPHSWIFYNYDWHHDQILSHNSHNILINLLRCRYHCNILLQHQLHHNSVNIILLSRFTIVNARSFRSLFTLLYPLHSQCKSELILNLVNFSTTILCSFFFLCFMQLSILYLWKFISNGFISHATRYCYNTIHNSFFADSFLSGTIYRLCVLFNFSIKLLGYNYWSIHSFM